MKYTGWILAVLFIIIVVLQQLTIQEYKTACRNYREAINIYENRITIETSEHRCDF